MTSVPERVTPREGVFVLAVAFALTAYFTWPLAWQPTGWGRVELGDGQFSIWNVAWVAHALTTPGVEVFDANIFHPHKRTLAYSEPNLGAGTIAVPAYLLTRGNPYAAHNSAVLVSLTFAVVGMYLLARRLTGSREAALLAGIAFAFCPFFFARTAHIQLMMTAPLPFTLLALHRFADAATVRRAIVLGISIGVQALFCAYYGVLAGLIVGLGILVFAVGCGYWRQPRWWALSVLAAVVSGLTVLPFFLPFMDLQRETGFSRTIDESIRWSADWRAYLASSAWAHRWMLEHLRHWKEVLFPGFTALLFGLGGMGLMIRHLARRGGTPLPMTRINAVFYLLVFVLTLWSSFGPNAGLYTLFFHTIPVFSLLRAPARFGIAVTLALCVFAAAALSVILQRVPPRLRTAVTAVLAILLVAELTTPLPYLPARDVPRAYKVLAAAERGAVAEFPFYYEPHDRFRHTLYMLGSTTHWQPLVNGYSDFMPPDFLEGAAVASRFPDPESFAWLRARDTRYVVFHLGLYGGTDYESLMRRLETYSPYLKPRWAHGSVLLYEIVGWPPGAP
ncbi:MAG TPA: hypothetical protein VM364_11415 [Vicinamibacterales bacterium]|nr:hypothetical protein [Vicinamibacterales bacterium]